MLPPSDPLLRGALLVRVPADGPDWAARLPRVPGGRVLTVTVGSPSLLEVPVDDLVEAGYRIVGRSPAEEAFAGVDVLVDAALRREAPGWWRRLLARADRVFDLRMGPVMAVLGEEVALHLRATCGEAAP